MTRLVVLLPPSEGKADGGSGVRVPGAFPGLERDRAAIGKALRRRGFDAAGQFKVGPASAAAAMAANRQTESAPVLAALRRYTGVLYGALDYPGRPAPVRRRLDASVIVVSGRWGLLRGDDPVPAYKLPIGATLPGVGRLAAWWRPRLTPALAEHVIDAVVWNLLPAAYGAAIGALPGARSVWTVRVEREVGGRRSVVGHDNKAVKGALTRAVVEADAPGPDALTGWEGPAGYRIETVTGSAVVLVSRA